MYHLGKIGCSSAVSIIKNPNYLFLISLALDYGGAVFRYVDIPAVEDTLIDLLRQHVQLQHE